VLQASINNGLSLDPFSIGQDGWTTAEWRHRQRSAKQERARAPWTTRRSQPQVPRQEPSKAHAPSPGRYARPPTELVLRPADIQDRDGARLVLDRRTRCLLPFTQRTFVDAGYRDVAKIQRRECPDARHVIDGFGGARCR